MLAEEARDLLDGVHVLADDVARLRGDLLAASLVLRDVLHDRAGELAHADREHADRHDAVLPRLAVLDDLAAVRGRAREELREVGHEPVHADPVEVAERVELLQRARHLGEEAVALDDEPLRVDDHDACRDVLDERVGRPLEVLLEVDVAHRLLGLAGEERLGELAARVVAARAAVDLVRLRGLPHARKRAGDGGLVRLVVHDGRRRIRGRAAMREAPPRRRADRRRRVRREQRREARGAARHRRTVHAAARTRQHLDEQLARKLLGMALELRGIEILQHPTEILKAGHGNVPHVRPAVAQRGVPAALDGVEAPLLGRTERELRLLAKLDAPLFEELLKRGEEDRQRQFVGMRVGLVLLRRAGSEEHDLRLVAELLLDEAAVRADGRGKRRDERRVAGQVLAYHIDGRRAGRRDDERGIRFLEELRDVRAHRLRAVGRLAHAGETGRLQRGGDLSDRHALEVAGEARRDGRVQLRAGRNKFLQAREVAPDLLRVGGTHLHAFAAGDARLGNHARLAIDNADGLHGTVPDALVAVLALVLRRIDWTGDHILSIILSAGMSPRGCRASQAGPRVYKPFRPQPRSDRPRSCRYTGSRRGPHRPRP